MRLIDADALKTKAETIQTIDCWHMRTEEQAVLVEHIDNAQTIDAVPVVRCKDCKRRKNAKENGRVYWDGYEYYCGIARYGVTDDGFCFYGERRGDD